MLATSSRLIQASQKLDKDFHSLIATAERVQKELGKEDARSTWEEDKKVVAELLGKGMRISMKRIDQLLPAEAKAGEQTGSIDMSSDLSYNEVSRLFKNTHPQEKRLRETLIQTTKGLRRIVRCLPDEEADI